MTATTAVTAAVDISTRAMLARLTISQWTARKYDRKASDTVAREYDAARDAGRYNKALIASDALAAIQRIVNAARAWHYAHTLPWADEGARLLSAAAYFDYTTALSAYRDDFEVAVGRFADAYPTLVDEARSRLGKLFNEADYPQADGIDRRFGFEIALLPVPSSGDFRVDLAAHEVERVREEIEARNAAAVDTAMRDVWTRVYDAVEHMHERLSAYTPTDTRSGARAGGVFRDSLVDNLRDLVGVLPMLNVTNDASLGAMTKRLERSLCAHDAETLRIDERKRGGVAEEAARILSEMRAYVGDVEVRA